MSEPPIGIEPMTYALRVACCLPAHALPAPIAREIARMALTTLGLPSDPVHEPVHAQDPAYCLPATAQMLLMTWIRAASGPSVRADGVPVRTTSSVIRSASASLTIRTDPSAHVREHPGRVTPSDDRNRAQARWLPAVTSPLTWPPGRRRARGRGNPSM